MLLSQFQSPCHFLLAYLEDYKSDPHGTQPLLTVSVFDDLCETHDIGLVRCDVVNRGIRDEEGRKIARGLIDIYGEEEEFAQVEVFNGKPGDFDVEDYVSRRRQKWVDFD